MLKISIQENSGEKTILLEGKFTEPWISVITKVWHEEQQSLNGRSCIVDLTDVTDIDQCGVAILSQMIREGVKFVADGVFTSYLIESLQNKTNM